MTLPAVIQAGVFYSPALGRAGEETPERTVPGYEIELPLEKGGVSYIDDRNAAITPNTVICAKPGQVRHTKLPLKTYYVHLSACEGTLREVLSNMPSFVSITDPEGYWELFKKMVACRESGGAYAELMLQGLCLQLIYTLYRDSRELSLGQERTSANRAAFEAAVRYIDGHLSQDLSLESVAGYVGLSPFYFHKYFKSVKGVTLHRYVEEKRIKKASELLVETDGTLTEIAYECGFSSQAYFSYIFKKRTGFTPRDYARNVYRRYHQAPTMPPDDGADTAP